MPTTAVRLLCSIAAAAALAAPRCARPTQTKLAAATADPAVASREAFDDVVQKTYGRYPVTIVRGSGCELEDDAGRTYLDFVAGISTCCLGHGDQRLVDAITKQIQEVHHVSNLYYIPNQGALAAWLVKNTAGLDKAFFCNSGGEANEAAIKLSLKHAVQERGLKDPVILTAYGSFHGRTMATISATAQPKYHGPEACWKVPGLAEHFEFNDIASLEAAFEKHEVAAILVEPIQGEGGVRVGTQEFLQKARELCDASGALLVFDEVQCGVGRTGRLWGHEHVGVTPDVLTCAKALGGGVPIGAMLCADKANVFAPGDHATTYGGNPLACAAALAVARAVDDDGLVANAAARGAQLEAGLRAMGDKYAGKITEVRGRGLLLGLELSSELGGAAKFVQAAADRGLLLVPAGADVVRFVPPLVVKAEQIDAALGILEECLAEA